MLLRKAQIDLSMMRFRRCVVVVCACASTPEAATTIDLSPAALSRGLRCTGAHCDVRRPLADSIIRALREQRQAALPRIVPALDRRDGIKLYAVRPGSPFEQLGVRNGDLIRAVDGVPLVAARLRESLEPLAARTVHTVELERDGGIVTLDFSIVD
jgi:S1-C subfamily serine protease